MANAKKSKRIIQLFEQLVREYAVNEADIEDLSDVCYTAGSTHIMQTCKLAGNEYYLKFSDESLFDESNPSLQILVEYLAYRIYALYKNVSIPSVELVYDKKSQRVGLASSSVKGKHGLTSINAKKLGKMLSAGIYVDIFLANWDAVGTGTGNVIVADDKATRIDPGGSLTFRAQGGRKGRHFSGQASELDTMLDPGFGGAGVVFSHGDLKVAAKEFLAVKWPAIEKTIKSVDAQVTADLQQRGMLQLKKEWRSDVNLIASTLKQRYAIVSKHASHVL